MNGNCGSQNNVYIGARYVPKIVGEWSADIAYEPLTVVLYQGTSYTSITYVPKGIIPSESTKQYWSLTGNYNAQVEMYRQEVERLKALVSYEIDTTSLMIEKTDLENGRIVHTNGYSSIGDGGEAYFQLTNQKLSSIFQIELTNGQFATLLNDKPNTKQCVGDNGNISDLINFLLENYQYCIISDNCNYTLDKTITLKSNNNLIGSLSTELTCTSDIVFTMNNVSWVNIEKLNLIGNNSQNQILFNGETTENKGIINCIFKDIKAFNFGIGIKTSWSWGNYFENVRFNSTYQCLQFNSQCNNNVFVSCHFLGRDNGIGENTTPIGFTNNDINTFYGCEFANGVSLNLYASKVILDSCYLELINQPFVKMGTTSILTQNNVFKLLNSHHSIVGSFANTFVQVQVNSPYGERSEIVNNSMNTKLQLICGRPISFKVENTEPISKIDSIITSNSNFLLDDTYTRVFEYGNVLSKGKSDSPYFMFKTPLDYKQGDRIKIRLKGVIGKNNCFILLRKSSQNVQNFILSDTNLDNILGDYLLEGVCSGDVDEIVIWFAQSTPPLIKYCAIGKLGNFENELENYINGNIYASSKPSYTPDKELTVFSSATNEIFTFNGSGWL